MQTSVHGLIGMVLLACLAAAPARGEDVKAGDLVISQAWSRATPGGAKVGAGYLTIENKGSAVDKLVSVTGDAAGKIEIYEMATVDGVMKIGPGAPVKVADPNAPKEAAKGGAVAGKAPAGK